MTRREDYGSHTEHDAGLFEAHRVQDTYDDGRPTRAECLRDDAEPVCDCYPGGWTYDTYDGPHEDCPVHGRDAEHQEPVQIDPALSAVSKAYLDSLPRSTEPPPF